MPSQPTTAGIVTDENSGERHIPESKRADGTTRKAIKIRPGYRPPEDVEVYKNRTAEALRARGRAMGVPGAAGLRDDDDKPDAASSASNKNAKRREARKKAKAAAADSNVTDENNAAGKKAAAPAKADGSAVQDAAVDDLDPEVEREKKARNLKKKLRQAKELKDKKDGGQSLLPEQIAKVIKINELIRELDALGFDQDGEPKTKNDKVPDTKTNDGPKS